MFVLFLFQWIAQLFSNFLFFAGYVSGSEAFPKPLPPDEEKEYFELYKKGDAAAKNILIEHNLRLVAHIAKKYTADKELDDLISVGTIGLIKAINSFDPEKNSRLGTYAAKCIENEILMLMRSSKKQNNEISMDECIGTDKEGNSKTFADILTAEEDDISDVVSDKIEIRRMYAIMDKVLKPAEVEIIRLRYGLGNAKRKTQKEIADMMGISRSYVSRIEKKAIKKLSDALKRPHD